MNGISLGDLVFFVRGAKVMERKNRWWERALGWIAVKVISRRRVCEWYEFTGRDGDIWESGCNVSYVFDQDGPVENGMKYCPFCGLRLVAINR